ncbi:MAG: hypothetical protein DSY87_08800 [Methylococcus sp.]|nr:MAG: hypothetical protein DSY87_08800 [Methylococcus sp.]
MFSRSFSEINAESVSALLTRRRQSAFQVFRELTATAVFTACLSSLGLVDFSSNSEIDQH